MIPPEDLCGSPGAVVTPVLRVLPPPGPRLCCVPATKLLTDPILFRCHHRRRDEAYPPLMWICCWALCVQVYGIGKCNQRSLLLPPQTAARSCDHAHREQQPPGPAPPASLCQGRPIKLRFLAPHKNKSQPNFFPDTTRLHSVIYRRRSIDWDVPLPRLSPLSALRGACVRRERRIIMEDKPENAPERECLQPCGRAKRARARTSRCVLRCSTHPMPLCPLLPLLLPLALPARPPPPLPMHTQIALGPPARRRARRQRARAAQTRRRAPQHPRAQIQVRRRMLCCRLTALSSAPQLLWYACAHAVVRA